MLSIPNVVAFDRPLSTSWNVSRGSWSTAELKNPPVLRFMCAALGKRGRSKLTRHSPLRCPAKQTIVHQTPGECKMPSRINCGRVCVAVTRGSSCCMTSQWSTCCLCATRNRSRDFAHGSGASQPLGHSGVGLCFEELDPRAWNEPFHVT